MARKTTSKPLRKISTSIFRAAASAPGAPPHTGRTGQRGFTLIELLFAITILSIGILGVATMQVSSINNNLNASVTTGAATAAEATIETLINLPWNSALLNDTTAESVTSPLIVQGDYRISWDVTDDLVNNFKTITITVRWTDRGIPKNLSFDFIKSQGI